MKQNIEQKVKQLQQEIKLLKKQNKELLKNAIVSDSSPKVKVPKEVRLIFDKAEKTVGDYFSSLKFSPSKGAIEINNERYVLVRASALSHEFLNSIKELYSNRGEDEANSIGKNILFDVAHLIGLEDAKNFHHKMNLKDPVSKLSAGPVHFAYTGWAFVDILPGSNPSPDENYILKYRHPFSFEADSWISAGKKSKTPVCIMNAGYSSGWCEASFGMSLTAVEITCRAKGDEHCSFIMAPPHKVDQYIKLDKKKKQQQIAIPAFLERKKSEEELKASLLEKEVLLKEIHHRVKNNLQIVSSLLNLQAHNIDDPIAKEKYQESIGRIKSMAIIHELLYRSKNLSHIHIREYIQELMEYISETYSVDQRIKMHLDFKVTSEWMELDTAIPCGIILNELLSNAFKHAFPKGKKGKIEIVFKNIEYNSYQYCLTIKDNGKGIPLKLNSKNPETLGLQLIQSLVEQLNGEMFLDSSKGTEFRILF